VTVASHSHLKRPPGQSATAVVYCEANFGCIDGKTANGLVRQSEQYEILSVIDSHRSGLDSGDVLGDASNAIPICASLSDAITLAGDVPDVFIFGIAPASGMLSVHERGVVLEAMSLGMDIVSGLHEFLGDDPVFVAAQLEHNVTIRDVRRPRDKRHLRLFDGTTSRSPVPASRYWKRPRGREADNGHHTDAHEYGIRRSWSLRTDRFTRCAPRCGATPCRLPCAGEMDVLFYASSEARCDHR
jgi:hypothetical protein